jgi:hypothetical protein
LVSQHVPLAGIAHNCGTVRFGTDPARSANALRVGDHLLERLGTAASVRP